MASCCVIVVAMEIAGSVCLVVAGAMLLFLIWGSVRLLSGSDARRKASSAERDSDFALPTDADMRRIKGENESANTYFDTFAMIQRCAAAGDYAQALAHAQKAIGHLNAVARSMEGVTFRSPPLQFICEHAVLTRNQALLTETREFLARHKALRQFVDDVDSAVEDLAALGKAYDFVRANPGALQNKLAKTISVDARRLATLLSRAEKRNLIRRVRQGKTYALSVS